jgi:hypothetical protein
MFTTAARAVGSLWFTTAARAVGPWAGIVGDDSFSIRVLNGGSDAEGDNMKFLRCVCLVLWGVGLLVAGCGDGDDEAPVVFIDDEPGTGTNPGTNPGSNTGFSGQWGGNLTCDLREETSDGVQTDRQTLEGGAQFDANGDMLLIGPNNQLQAQDRQGLRFEYVLDGGGVGSRELVVLQKGATTRRYEYRYNENRTTSDSSGSSTYQRQAGELYDFTLNGSQLSVRYEAAAQVTSFVSTPAGSVQSNSSGSMVCTGTFSRR